MNIARRTPAARAAYLAGVFAAAGADGPMASGSDAERARRLGPDARALLDEMLAPAPVAPARCDRCECCPAALCAEAIGEHGWCALLVEPATPGGRAAIGRCPCAPLVCRCELPAHVRGIARCQHGRRRRGTS